MLNLYRRGEYWHIRGTVSNYEKSITIRQSTGARTKKEAVKILQSLEAQALYKLEGVNKTTPFILVANKWLNIKDRNSFDNWCVPKLCSAFSNKLINEITQDDWDEYRKDNLKNKTPSYINRISSVLNTILKYGKQKTIIKKEKVISDRIRYLTKEQQEMMFDSYPEYIRPLFITLAYQGLRIGEAIRLTQRHIDIEKNLILVEYSNNRDTTKGGRRRILPLHSRVKEAINYNNHIIFPNLNGDFYKEGKNIGQIHRRVCKKVGITDFTVHDWRHHWASRLTMKGASIPALMKLGGWEDERMVLRYASVSDQHIIDTNNLLD